MNPGENLVDLSLQFPDFRRALATLGVLSFGAVVINILQDGGVFHLFNWGLALRAFVSVIGGEFISAFGADDLVLLIGGDHGAAFAAPYQTPEGEGVFLRSWVAFPPQKYLNSVVFFRCYHCLMVSLIPVSTPQWILKPAVVKGISEYSVDHASGKRLPVTSSEPPFINGNVPDPGRRVSSSKHQLPHPLYQVEPIRILDDLSCPFHLRSIIQIAKRGEVGTPSFLQLRSQASFHVLAQIQDKLVCHPEFNIHEQYIIFWIVAPVESLDVFYNSFLEHPHYLRSVDGVSCQAIQLPADNTISHVLIYLLEHLIEYRSSGTLR